jgi:hypothetical protein
MTVQYAPSTLKRLLNENHGESWQNSNDLVDTILAGSHRVNRTLVDLTTAAQTTLYTVPEGYKFVCHGVNLVGQTAQSGAGKASTLKVGTAANSYAEMLGGGHILEVLNKMSLVGVNSHLPLFFNKLMPRMLSRTLVLLTAVAQTTLYTVPASTNAHIEAVVLEGDTAQSGGTSSKLLIGTTANSYVELLNGATGHTFISGTATSLLAAGARVNATYGLPGQTTMSLANSPRFVAGDVIKADVSGTVVTAGKVWVELWGNLDTDGPKEFAAGDVIKADVSGSALLTAGKVYAELFGRLIPVGEE